MQTLIAATTNVGKLKEIQKILKEFCVVSAAEAGFFDEIEETGETFLENAIIKAKTVFSATKKPSIADDSGLVVDALGGLPGIYSARYAGTGKDKDNIKKLLFELKDKPSRKAKFVSAIALVLSETKILTAIGEAFGEILFEEKGDGGFGYDPIFYSFDLKKTFSEASDEEKNMVSHRGKALQNLFEKFHSIS